MKSEKREGKLRKIIHLDMDCFFAAVEIRENPGLKDKPVAVGGGGRRGVVTTCNYRAREFGVRSAMPGFKARELCPDLIFLPVRHDLYTEESRRIRKLMQEITDRIEPLSLDEAYLDVSLREEYAWDLAKRLRQRIWEVTGLTASAGIAANKMLAKIASDWRKPNGQFAILPKQVEAFMKGLGVKKLWGVGPRSVEKLAQMGVHTCGDLQQIELSELVRIFGNWGAELYDLCRGIDVREVETHRERKSVSNEVTFTENLQSEEHCLAQLPELIADLEERLGRKKEEKGIRKLFVKVKFADFRQTTCERLGNKLDLEKFEELLIEALLRNEAPVRLLGVGVRFDEREKEGERGEQWEFEWEEGRE